MVRHVAKIAVTDGDQVLLVKHPDQGLWSLPSICIEEACRMEDRMLWLYVRELIYGKYKLSLPTNFIQSCELCLSQGVQARCFRTTLDEIAPSNPMYEKLWMDASRVWKVEYLDPEVVQIFHHLQLENKSPVQPQRKKARPFKMN